MVRLKKRIYIKQKKFQEPNFHLDLFLCFLLFRDIFRFVYCFGYMGLILYCYFLFLYHISLSHFVNFVLWK